MHYERLEAVLHITNPLSLYQARALLAQSLDSYKSNIRDQRRLWTEPMLLVAPVYAFVARMSVDFLFGLSFAEAPVREVEGISKCSRTLNL